MGSERKTLREQGVALLDAGPLDNRYFKELRGPNGAVMVPPQFVPKLHTLFNAVTREDGAIVLDVSREDLMKLRGTKPR